MDKKNKVLLFVLISAFIFRIIIAYTSPILWWDEAVYANLGHDLTKNPLDYSFENNGWSDFVPDGQWPKAGFRPPLLPLILAIFYFLKINSLIFLIIPLIGTLSVFFTYLLGKKLFGERVGLYSAIFLALSPLHVIHSSKILTGVLSTFLGLLTFFIFWKGYEEKNNKFKVLFGLFFALAVLTRYNMIWFLPIFLLYFIVRNKSFKFLFDKYLWYSILAFFIVLTPWMIYGFLEYNNFLGPFIHASNAASFWGGVSPGNFLFYEGWDIFSISGIIFILALLYITYKKEFKRKEIYFLLIWIAIFLWLFMFMSHKEDRHLLPIFPPLMIICGFFVKKIKKFRKPILILLIIFMLIILSKGIYLDYKKAHTGTIACFLEANNFLKSVEKNSAIITDESPSVYYYTKKETYFYPNPWSLDKLAIIKNNHFQGKNIYIFFTDYDMPLHDKEHIKIKKDLDDNFEKVFTCDKNWGLSAIYKYD